MMLCIAFFGVLSLTYTGAIPNEPFIVFSNRTNIISLDVSTLVLNNVLGELDLAVPLGYDTVNKHLYTGEHTSGRIYRLNYDGSGKTLIISDAINVEGVAVDWISRNIYWSSFDSHTIEVATLEGKFRNVLVYNAVENPHGIAVDPFAGYLFWSDWGNKAVIERCSLDGTNRLALITENIKYPSGVTLDTTVKIIYWIDSYHDTITSVDYDGKNRKVIFQYTSPTGVLFYGFDLDFTGDSMYYTDWSANAIYGVKISTGVVFANISVPTSIAIQGVMGLRVIDGSKQQSAPKKGPTITNVTAGLTNLIVTWEKLSVNDSGGEITKYEVCYELGSSVSDCNISNEVSGVDNTTAVLTGLEPAKMYTVAVRAYTTVGPGPLGTKRSARMLTTGCVEIKMSSDFKKTSMMWCSRNSDNSVRCDVKCLGENNAVFHNFLTLKCYESTWIRKNNIGKYVRLANANFPPRCYKPTAKNSLPPYCRNGFYLTRNEMCVPCPPGSYNDRDRSLCVPCPVTMYQNETGKLSCKACKPKKTSTTSGSENCYFDYSDGSVILVFATEINKIDSKIIRDSLAKSLTKVCSSSTCRGRQASRKRRDDVNYSFTTEDVIVVDVKPVPNSDETKVECFVIDSSSTSSLPVMPFSSQDLRSLILEIDSDEMPYTLISVDITVDNEPTERPTTINTDSGLNIPLVVGVIVGVIVVIIVIAVLFIRWRKRESAVPVMQPSNTGNGKMSAADSTSHFYEDPDKLDTRPSSFSNQGYKDGTAVTPYYEKSQISIVTNTSPVNDYNGHVYETPADFTGLPEKGKMSDGAVVFIPNQKGSVAWKAESRVKPENELAKPNYYQFSGIPAGFEMERPRKLDDTKLQAMQENISASAMVNVKKS